MNTEQTERVQAAPVMPRYRVRDGHLEEHFKDDSYIAIADGRQSLTYNSLNELVRRANAAPLLADALEAVRFFWAFGSDSPGRIPSEELVASVCAALAKAKEAGL